MEAEGEEQQAGIEVATGMGKGARDVQNECAQPLAGAGAGY